VLVLTGSSDAQQRVFHDLVPMKGRLRLFGAAKVAINSKAPLDLSVPSATNYRRWWNNAWRVVEAGGQQHAGEWTPEKLRRLRALVERAHANGLWIRFYTLDGAKEDELSCHGWFHSYNFGDISGARKRWQAAINAGVDYIASDHYELLGEEIRQSHTPNASSR